MPPGRTRRSTRSPWPPSSSPASTSSSPVRSTRRAGRGQFRQYPGRDKPQRHPRAGALLGTIRTLSHDSAIRVRDRVRQIGHALGEASGAAIETVFANGIDGVFNDPGVTEICSGAAAEVVGSDHVDTIELPSMGGEDFAAYLAHVPGCMLRLGVASARVAAVRHHLHTPGFDIDKRALAIGAKVLAHSVVLLAECAVQM